MTLVALVGDCTTTTSLALAAGWRADDDVVVLEADRSGGSLAAWLDTPSMPSLSTIVANTARADPPALAATIDSMIRRSASGVRFIAAPVRTKAASRAVDEAVPAVVPALAADECTVTIADVGRPMSGERAPLLGLAQVVVICHRQESASAAAAAVRLERLAEFVDSTVGIGPPLVLAVIGADPFEPGEIAQYVEQQVPGALASLDRLAIDPLAAAVLAGRCGVSSRRLARLPLMRTAEAMAGRLRNMLDHSAPLAGDSPTGSHGSLRSR